MRKYSALGLLALTGCANCTANLCDTFFKARNVCRDQEAQAAGPAIAAPAVVTQPVISAPAIAGPPVYMGSSMDCAGTIVCSGPVISSECFGSEVYSSPIDCAGTVVMSPIDCACAGCAGEAVTMGSSIISADAGAVQTVSESKGHPLLRPFRWMHKHHASTQE